MDFTEFVATRATMLVRISTALTGDPALSEDLVQEVLIKVHRQWGRISELESPDGYVRRMVVNEFVSWRRKWARIIPAADVVPADTASDHADAHADRQLLDQQISRLSKRQQVVLALRYYEGLEDTHIARLLGCRVGTVRSLASRALASLRDDVALRSEFARTADRVREHGGTR